MTNVGDQDAINAVPRWLYAFERRVIGKHIAKAAQKESTLDFKILITVLRLPIFPLLHQRLHSSTSCHLLHRDTMPTVSADGVTFRARNMLVSKRYIFYVLAARVIEIFTILVNKIFVMRAEVVPEGDLRLVSASVARYGKADAAELAEGLDVCHLCYDA